MRQTTDTQEVGASATTMATYASDDERDLPTNHLQSDRLHPTYQPNGPSLYVAAGHADQPSYTGTNTDSEDREWLAQLAARALTTTHTHGQALSGMAQHSAPSPMVPTLGAKVSKALSKALVIAVYLLVIGIVAAGAYLLTSATWTIGPNSTGPGTGAGSSPVGADNSRQSQVSGGSQAHNPLEQQPQSQPQPQPGQAQGYGPEAGTGSDSMVVVPAAGTPAQLRDKGVQAYRAGNYEQAIILLEQAANLDGGNALTYYQLGLAYMATPQREHAMEDAELAFRTAISLQPEWAAPYVGLAESLLRRDLYRDAITPARQATQLEPQSVEAWLTLGRAYKGTGQEGEATRAFAEAARLAPAPPSEPPPLPPVRP